MKNTLSLKLKENKKRRIKCNKFGRVVLCIVIIYLFGILCNQQITIAQLNNKKDALKSQIMTQQKNNEAIKSQMTDKSKLERVEKIAREKLGYMKSDERLFVDASSK